MRNFVDFGWERTTSGYRIIRTEEAPPRQSRPARYLTDGVLPGERRSICRYDPLEEPYLFARFAALNPLRDDSILAFANEYGLLEEPVRIFLPQKDTHAGPPIGRGEPLTLWQKEIESMRYAVGLWEMIKKNDRKGLSEIIHWHGEDLYVSLGASGLSPLQARSSVEFRRDDVIEPARHLVLLTVNVHLRGRVSPQLLWKRDPTKRGGQRDMGLFFVPSSLIGALWLQFADTVDGDGYVRWCARCGEPFVAGAGEKRSNAQYCSQACQKLAWQREKRKAARKQRRAA